MPRILRLSFPLFLVCACLSQAQVKRPRISDAGPAAPVQARAGSADPTTRRSAIVVLSEPSAIEYLMQSEPKVLDAHSAGLHATAANPEHVRARLFGDEGQVRLASIQQNKAPLVTQLGQRGIAVSGPTETVLKAIMILANEEERARVL